MAGTNAENQEQFWDVTENISVKGKNLLEKIATRLKEKEKLHLMDDLLMNNLKGNKSRSPSADKQKSMLPEI